MNKSFFIVLLSVVFIYSCQPVIGPSIHDETVRINGTISDYKGIYKTGKLTYYDAITRTVNDEIFAIDSLGHFEVVFQLAHPILKSIYFDIENNYYTKFYIKPGEEYDITISDEKLNFDNNGSKENTQLKQYYEAFNTSLGEKASTLSRLHEQGLSPEEYIQKQKDFENEQLEFLAAFHKKNGLKKSMVNLLTSDIRFNTANSWINYRYDYSSGRPILRDSLPNNFYAELFDSYYISHTEDYQSLNCINYLSNIASVLQEKGSTAAKRIDFYKASNEFTEDQLKVLTAIYNDSKEIFKTEEFKRFNTQQNMDLESELSMRFNIHLLFENIGLLKTDLTKDLVLSQGISKNYFSNNLDLSQNEWTQLEGLISNKEILQYLKDFSSKKVTKSTNDINFDNTINATLEEIKDKYITPYKGKVVYIDFYSTWCGPCRQEIPFAKSLHYEFKDKDVVFLNLCARSKKENWKNLLKQQNIEGENFLLNDEEFNLLSKAYKVNGFPTYILMNKKGEVTNYNSPRPSSKEQIINEINDLLK